MTQKEIEKKYKDNQPNILHNSLNRIIKNEAFNESALLRFSTFHSNVKIIAEQSSTYKKGDATLKISEKTAKLGLVLLNCVPELRGKKKSDYYYENITLRSPRFKYLKENYDLENLWEGEHYNLLIMCFGEPSAKIVKTSYNKVGAVINPKGVNYNVRKRTNDNEDKLDKLNHIKYLITNETKHPFTLEEVMKYDNSNFDALSFLIASAIDNGNNNILKLCKEIVQGNAEKGWLSRTIIEGLFYADKQEVREIIGNLLLSAKRQEGLRQTLFESLERSSIGIFRHIIQLANRQELWRFSSVIRALNSWTGFYWNVEKQSTVKKFFQLADTYITKPELLKKAVKSKDNAEVYMALWAQGIYDINACYPYLKELYEKGSLEKKILALYFIERVNILEWDKEFGYLALGDENPVINYWAIRLFERLENLKKQKKLYEAIENLYQNFPEKSISFSGNVFSSMQYSFTKEQVINLLVKLTDFKKPNQCRRLLKNYDDFPIRIREEIAGNILHNYNRWYDGGKNKKPTELQREFAITYISERSDEIRKRAKNVLEQANITDEEVIKFEGFLTRKTAEFRQFVLKIIKQKGDIKALESAKRLIVKRNVNQRLAGLDLLNYLYKKQVLLSEINELVINYNTKKVGKKEQVLLDNLQQKQVIECNTENGYGLYNPRNKSKVVPLKPVTSGEFVDNFVNGRFSYGYSMSTTQIKKKLNELKDIFVANKDYEYTTECYGDYAQKVLLGNVFEPFSYFRRKENPTAREEFENYPLHELWEDWYKNSKLTPSDLFLFEINSRAFDYRLDNNVSKFFPKTMKNLKGLFREVKFPDVDDDYGSSRVLYEILEILRPLYPYKNEKEFYLNGAEYVFGCVDKEEGKMSILKKGEYEHEYTIWDFGILSNFIAEARGYNSENYSRLYTDNYSDEQFARCWYLNKSILQNIINNSDNINDFCFKDYLRAYSLNLCNKDEMTRSIMTEDGIDFFTSYRQGGAKKKEFIQKYPYTKAIAKQCVKRILEIELRRGDSSTTVSNLAANIQRIEGVDYLIKILNGLGKGTFNVRYTYDYDGERGKREMFVRFLSNTYPTNEETQEDFNSKIKKEKFTEKRLLELAAFAEQWTPFVEKYLNWKGLKSAMYWLKAHTNSYHTSRTETEVARFSKIDIEDFQKGAVDCGWFHEAYTAIGKKRWDFLYETTAKYISGNKRAKLYADIMLGKTKLREVTKVIKDKRNQDYVRAYGLIPLSKTTPEKDVLNRYRFLALFKKERKQFGAQRQESEALAVKIAMENLARTAGYPDPIRLTWAMETKEAKSILEKAEKLTFNNVTVELTINELGKSSIVIKRNDKEIKSLPKKLNKERSVKALKELHEQLKEQYSRSRKSLEEAMVQGDVFLEEEIQNLLKHPVIAPMAENLVFISKRNLGFYKDGKLVNTEGKTFALSENTKIAHCVDLYNSKQWTAYQRYCFENKIVQPFKQVFRELYVPTPDELTEKKISRRYTGHQVQPRKTMAILKSRGWTVDYEEGLQKVLHQEKIIAKVHSMADWFNIEETVEYPTLEIIDFLDKETHERIPFAKLNPIIFSEVMRDIDLVVSVAHVGGVDPEASQSTIEMRSAIISETVRLFKLKNVELKGHHALIKGEIGDYSVHLGSGVIHFNGKYISVLPVHSQHRGRLFLPFVDEDPRSAEIMAKILLFAKDKEIKDPTILEQLR